MCDCATPNRCEEGGFEYCLGCGQQLEQVLELGKEWRMSDDGSFATRDRVGTRVDPRFPTMALRTYVRNRPNAKGAALAAGYGIIRQHHWVSGTSYQERTRKEAMRLIHRSCQTLGMNREVQNRAELLFFKANGISRTRADGRVGVMAAAILLAARQDRVPRSPKELAQIFSTTPANITKGSKVLQTALHGSALLASDEQLYIGTASDFVPRFCSKLGVGETATAVARKIARGAVAKGIVRENTPPSVAGGAILYAAELALGDGARVPKGDKERIAAAAGVSVVTIAKVRKRLFTYRGHLLDRADVDRLRRAEGRAEGRAGAAAAPAT
jgi:transcription initiation factor TFIIB